MGCSHRNRRGECEIVNAQSRCSTYSVFFFFFFQAEDGIRDYKVTGVQTCALPISRKTPAYCSSSSPPAPGPEARSTRRRWGRGKSQRSWLRRSFRMSHCRSRGRSEEHTSELQSPCNLVCRLLLEKKKNITLESAHE